MAADVLHPVVAHRGVPDCLCCCSANRAVCDGILNAATSLLFSLLRTEQHLCCWTAGVAAGSPSAATANPSRQAPASTPGSPLHPLPPVRVTPTSSTRGEGRTGRLQPGCGERHTLSGPACVGYLPRPAASRVWPHAELAAGLVPQGSPHGFFRRRALLPMAPNGLDELQLLRGVEIAFNLAVTLLDRVQVASLLQVVDVFLGHAGAARQQFRHRMKFSQHIGRQTGPPLMLMCGVYRAEEAPSRGSCEKLCPASHPSFPGPPGGESCRDGPGAVIVRAQ